MPSVTPPRQMTCAALPSCLVTPLNTFHSVGLPHHTLVISAVIHVASPLSLLCDSSQSISRGAEIVFELYSKSTKSHEADHFVRVLWSGQPMLTSTPLGSGGLLDMVPLQDFVQCAYLATFCSSLSVLSPIQTYPILFFSPTVFPPYVFVIVAVCRTLALMDCRQILTRWWGVGVNCSQLVPVRLVA